MSAGDDQAPDEGRFFSEIFERAPVGIHIQSASGTLERVNRAFLDILGMAEGDCLGRNWIEFHADPEAARDIIDRTARGEAVRDGETTLRAKDGTSRFTLVSADAIGQPGSGLHVRCFTRDITHLKRVQLALEEADQRKAAILNASLDAIITMDAEGRLVDFNVAAETIFGYLRSDAIGRQLAELIIPAQLRQAHAEGLRRYLATGDGPIIGKRVEVSALHASGRQFPVELSVSPVEGRRPLFTATLRDISDRKAARAALLEADRNKDAFIASLAHELRNPLAPMRNAAALLGMQGLSPERQGWAVDVISRQISHMSRLLDDLLDAARISHGKLALQRRPVELHAVVRSAVEIVHVMIEERGQSLAVDLPPGDVTLQADPVRLAQVLSNLLVNASKYSDQGTRIDLRASVEGDELRIDVVDQGIGLDPADLDQLFTMFKQVSAQHGLSASGLGVGLALSRSLIEMHGGSIQAASQGLGCGSTFTIRIPLITPALP